MHTVTCTSPTGTFTRSKVDESRRGLPPTSNGSSECCVAFGITGTLSISDAKVGEQVSRWMTLAEAGDYARVSALTLRREVRALRLHAYRVGGRRALRLKADDIDRWLESTEAAATRISEGPKS
jgi:excisionase family DNA binding protein